MRRRAERKPPGPPPAGHALVVASYNVHGGVGADGRLLLARTVSVIRSLGADIIALQEVSGHRDARGAIDHLQFLTRALGLTAVPGPTLLRDTGPYGNALLTRLPLISSRQIDLSVGRAEPRGAIDVRLDVHGRSLRVIATHLGLRRRERRAQRRLLAAAIAEDDGPLVLLGDFNECWPVVGCLDDRWPGLVAPRSPATFPARWPLLALDRVLFRPSLALRELSAVRTPLTVRASDHLPVRAVLTLDGVAAAQPAAT